MHASQPQPLPVRPATCNSRLHIRKIIVHESKNICVDLKFVRDDWTHHPTTSGRCSFFPPSKLEGRKRDRKKNRKKDGLKIDQVEKWFVLVNLKIVA